MLEGFYEETQIILEITLSLISILCFIYKKELIPNVNYTTTLSNAVVFAYVFFRSEHYFRETKID